MAEYQGYTGKGGWNKSYAAGNKLYVDATAKRKKDEEDARLAKANNDLIDGKVDGSGNKQGSTSEKKGLDKAYEDGGVAGWGAGILGLGKDIAVQTKETYERVGEGFGELAGEATGANQSIRDNQSKDQEMTNDLVKTAGEKMNDESLSADERARWKKVMDKYAKDDSAAEAIKATSERQIDKADAVKNTGALLSVGLDVATAGTVSNAFKAGKTATKAMKASGAASVAAKESSKSGIRKFGESAAQGSALGAGYGVAGTAEQLGSEANALDYAKGIGAGAAIGGALGPAALGFSKAVGAGFGRLKSAKTPAQVTKAVDEIVAENIAQAEGKQLLLGTGTRASKDIEGDMQRIQDGTDESVFKYTTSDGTDVTSKVADFDKQISARKQAIQQLETQSKGVDNNTGKADVPEGVDPSEYTGDLQGRTKAAEAVDTLKAEVKDLEAQQATAFESLGGVSKSMDNALVKEKFVNLKKELDVATEYEAGVQSSIAREEAQAIDVKALNKESADLANGVVPDSMLLPYKRLKTVDEAEDLIGQIDPEDTNGIMAGAIDVRAQRSQLADERAKTYTQEAYDTASKQVNKEYRAEMAKYEGLPEPVAKEKIDALNEKVLAKYDELEYNLEASKERIAELDEIEGQIKAQEEAIVGTLNTIRDADPKTFRDTDTEMVAARQQEISHQKFLAQDAENPIAAGAVLRDVSDSGESIAEVAKTNSAVAKAVDTAVQEEARVLARQNSGKQAGLGWLMGTPTRVLEKFGPAGKKIADNLRKAVDQKEKLDGVFDQNMSSWGKLIRGKEATEKVAMALDGDEAAVKSLLGNEKKAYDEIKAWFADMADEMNIPKEGRIQDYLPHLFEGKNIDQMQQTLALLRAGKKNGKDLTQKQIDKLENALVGVDAKTLSYLTSTNNYRAKNGFLEKRKGAPEYSLDLEKILVAYNNAGTSKIAYEPRLAEINGLSRALDNEQKRYLTAVTKSLQGETDTILERSIDQGLGNLSNLTNLNFGGKGTTSRLSKAARNGIYNATIGANVGSAVRNTQQGVNIFTEVGAKSMIESAPRALRSLKHGTAERDLLYRNGVLSNHQGQYLQNGKTAGFKSKSTKVLWGMFNTTETLNRATAFFSGYDKHLVKFPSDIIGAEKAGSDLARKTNFKFSAIDIPVAMQGDVAKNFLQMQTYNIQQTQYIARMVGEADPRKIFTRGKDGKWSMNLEPQIKIARFLGGNAAFFGTIGAASGMDWKEAIPFSSEIVSTLGGDPQVPRSPIAQLLIGDGKANKGILPTVSSAAGSVFSGNWEQVGKDADAIGRSGFRTVVPGGNQIIKTVEGAASAATGISATGSGITDTAKKAASIVTGEASGNVRFTQGQGAWNSIKATVLGQYATQDGRDWVTSGMNNVPTNKNISGQPASDYIKSLPRSAQEQYVAFYTNKAQSDEALTKQFGTRSAFKKEATELLRSGQMTYQQFTDEMKQYNAAVVESMGGYLDGNQKMPLRIRDEISKNMLIEVGTPSSYKQKKVSTNVLEQENAYLEDDTSW